MTYTMAHISILPSNGWKADAPVPDQSEGKGWSPLTKALFWRSAAQRNRAIPLCVHYICVFWK